MDLDEVNWGYRAEEYMQLMHDMQTGVKFIKEHTGDTDESATGSKHLRVGVNSALVSNAALAVTLIEAGVITYEALRDNEIMMLRREVDQYTNEIREILGVDVTLQ